MKKLILTTKACDRALLINDSLEQLSEFNTDLTPLVYKCFFRRYPEARELFGHDENDSLKGDMLSRLIVQIMDCAEGRANSEIIASWASDHIAYGVKFEMFPAMFDSLEEALRELLGDESWTPSLQEAWQFQFGGLLAIVEAAFQRFSHTAK